MPVLQPSYSHHAVDGAAVQSDGYPHSLNAYISDNNNLNECFLAGRGYF
jgi:hypothetical protein